MHSIWTVIEPLFNGEPALWLWVEGVSALFGPGILFLVWGAVSHLTKEKGTVLVYNWKEWAEPLGWLYGAIVLDLQSGVRSIRYHLPIGIMIASFVTAFFSLVFLFKSMDWRGSDSTWKPPSRLKVAAILLVVSTLYVGFAVHSLSDSDGGSLCPQISPTLNH